MSAVNDAPAFKETPITQTARFGTDNKGLRFDDLDIVGGSEDAERDDKHPIVSIQIVYGQIIDGIGVTYKRKDGDLVTIHHGTSFGTQGLGKKTFKIGPNERIVSVEGTVANFRGENRVAQLKFTISSQGSINDRTEGPVGFLEGGEVFHCNFTEKLFGLSGYALDTDSPVGAFPDRGLFSLIFQKK